MVRKLLYAYQMMPWRHGSLSNSAKPKDQYCIGQRKIPLDMTTSWHGNAFGFTGPLCRESTGNRWIPSTKGQQCGALIFSLLLGWTSCCCRWFKAPCRSRHCNENHLFTYMHGVWLNCACRSLTGIVGIISIKFSLACVMGSCKIVRRNANPFYKSVIQLLRECF